MAIEFDGSTQYITCTPPFRGGSTVSASMWLKFDAAADQNAFGVWGVASGDQEWLLQFSSARGMTAAVRNSSGGYGIASSASSVWSTGTWFHAAMRYDGTNVTGWINGTQVCNTGRTGAMTTGTSPLTIGRQPSGGYVDGCIVEAAVWQAALTLAEVTSLSRGFAAHRICPQSLEFYAPLVREVIDEAGGAALTQNGSPTVAVHPRII